MSNGILGKILNFADFGSKFKDRVDSAVWMYRLHNITTGSSDSDGSTGQRSYWSFYRIVDCFPSTAPTLLTTVRVFDDLHVEIFYENVGRLPDSIVKLILDRKRNGQKASPVLTLWRQFDELLSQFYANDQGRATDVMKQQMTVPQRQLSTEETNHKSSANTGTEFVLELEPAWSMEEDSPDQPSAVYSTAQPMSDNTPESLLFMNSRHLCFLCPAAFVLVSSLELHLASVHGEKLYIELPGSSTPDRCDSGVDYCSDSEPDIHNDCSDSDWEPDSHRKRQTKRRKKMSGRDTSNKIGKNFHGEKLRMVLPGSSPPDRHDAGNCSDTDKNKKVDSHSNGTKPVKKNIEEDSPDQPSAVHSTEQPRSDNTSGSHTHPSSPNHTGPMSFECDVCGKSFPSISRLETHKLTHSADIPFDMYSKSLTENGNKKRVQSKNKLYKCPHCGKDFKQSGHLHHHTRAVHEGKKYVCDDCGAPFTHFSSLKTHKRIIHAGEKPFVCSTCGKRFTCSTSLKRHHQFHTGEKPHACSDCGKRFFSVSELKQHMVVHRVDDKPLVCEDCGKGFNRPVQLREHRLKHAQTQKPHTCPDCGKRFARADALESHRQSVWAHSNKKIHRCPDCPSAYVASSQLKVHIQRKHGQAQGEMKTHQCPHCPLAYTWPQTLKSHIQRKHQEENETSE